MGSFPLTFQGKKVWWKPFNLSHPFLLKKVFGNFTTSEQVLKKTYSFVTLVCNPFFQSATKPIMLARMSGSLKRQHFLWSFPTIPPRNNNKNRFNPGIVFVSEILAIRFHFPIVKGFGSRVQWLCWKDSSLQWHSGYVGGGLAKPRWLAWGFGSRCNGKQFVGAMQIG